MLEETFVEDKEIVEASGEEVEKVASKRNEEKEGYELPKGPIFGPIYRI